MTCLSLRDRIFCMDPDFYDKLAKYEKDWAEVVVKAKGLLDPKAYEKAMKANNPLDLAKALKKANQPYGAEISYLATNLALLRTSARLKKGMKRRKTITLDQAFKKFGY